MNSFPRIPLFLINFCWIAALNATPIVVPPGLNPGDSYRLVFVTSTTRDATSANLADYDTFVNLAATSIPELAALGTTWSVIGATLTMNASDHLGGSPAPIYNLGGLLVANGMGGPTGLFGGLGGSIQHMIDYQENGQSIFAVKVWSGTNPANGDRTTTPLGGGIGLSSTLASFGTIDNNCCAFQWLANSSEAYTLEHRFYGISGILTVPNSTPEPNSAFAVILGLVAICHRRLGLKG